VAGTAVWSSQPLAHNRSTITIKTFGHHIASAAFDRMLMTSSRGPAGLYQWRELVGSPPLLERGEAALCNCTVDFANPKADPPHSVGLLRACDERPKHGRSDCRAAEEGGELAPLHLSPLLGLHTRSGGMRVGGHAANSVEIYLRIPCIRGTVPRAVEER
jgi:hypothetical protein